jgi:hypothetical protein
VSLRRALAWVGAIVAAFCGVTVLWDVVGVARVFSPLFRDIVFSVHETGSGGLGAVSAEAAQVSIAVLGVIPAAVANRWLAKRARTTHRRLRSLYRLHSALLLAVAAGVVLLVLAFLDAFLSFPVMLAVELLTLLAVGAQFLVLAGMLAILN